MWPEGELNPQPSEAVGISCLHTWALWSEFSWVWTSSPHPKPSSSYLFLQVIFLQDCIIIWKIFSIATIWCTELVKWARFDFTIYKIQSLLQKYYCSNKDNKQNSHGLPTKRVTDKRRKCTILDCNDSLSFHSGIVICLLFNIIPQVLTKSHLILFAKWSTYSLEFVFSGGS